MVHFSVSQISPNLKNIAQYKSMNVSSTFFREWIKRFSRSSQSASNKLLVMLIPTQANGKFCTGSIDKRNNCRIRKDCTVSVTRNTKQKRARRPAPRKSVSGSMPWNPINFQCSPWISWADDPVRRLKTVYNIEPCSWSVSGLQLIRDKETIKARCSTYLRSSWGGPNSTRTSQLFLQVGDFRRLFRSAGVWFTELRQLMHCSKVIQSL